MSYFKGKTEKNVVNNVVNNVNNVISDTTATMEKVIEKLPDTEVIKDIKCQLKTLTEKMVSSQA